MAVIIKSNVRYTGHHETVSAKQLTMTPAEIFQEYVSRVVGDGGEIIDSSRTLSTIEFLHSRKLFGKMNSAVGAYYGIKRAGTDVHKLYALDGNDLVAAIFGSTEYPTLDESGAHLRLHTVSTGSSTGCAFTSESLNIIPSKRGSFGFAFVGEDDPVYPRDLSFSYCGGQGSGQTAQMIQLQLTNIGTASSLIPNSLWTPTNNATSNAVSPLTAGDGVCTMVSRPRQNHRVYRNGVLEQTRHVIPPAYVETLGQMLTAGVILNDSLVSTGSGYFSEFWAFNDLTDEDAAAISERLGDLY